MRNYKINYKLILEGSLLQSGNNKFDVDKKVRTVIKDTLLLELERRSGFSTLFKDGDFNVKLEIEDYKPTEDKKVKIC